MNRDYVLTSAAADDVDEILLYVAQRSGADAAMKVWSRLDDAMSKLVSKPGLGHHRPDLGDQSLRAYTVFKYVIIFRSEPSPIVVVRVLHGARDIGAIMGGH